MLAGRPSLFAPHESPFWNDPYIASQILGAHLDTNTDAASRSPDTIDRSINLLVDRLKLRPGHRVVDFGRGPGLYCQRLARRGLEVVGVDFSTVSLDYARAEATRERLPIDYVQQDYTSLDSLDIVGLS